MLKSGFLSSKNINLLYPIKKNQNLKKNFDHFFTPGVRPPAPHCSAQGWKFENRLDDPSSSPEVNFHEKFQLSTSSRLGCRGRVAKMGAVASSKLSQSVVLEIFFLKVFLILLLMVQVALFYLYLFGYNIFLKMIVK